ncbi:MAG: UDP-N-acetylmuramoyl-L-alanyl-D-glutamate--2,6-diaminopimelate ligase [Elusimicrobia bacterium]|nr:UDP-N-acetylmuramoyl-L-alanyl-D-glutamate--2,6-diaminopimelate ligase [Elusimicrobiota bacterium]
MKLKELLSVSGVRVEKIPAGNPAVKGVSYNSNEVKPGWLFFALKGSRVDGLDFASEAERKGAVAVVSDRPSGKSGKLVLVKDAKKAMAKIAEAFYGFPSRKLDLIGVTGTNGKTTVTYFLDSIFRSAGIKSAVFGTINYRWDGFSRQFPNTTVESADISRHLLLFLKAGGKAVFLEVTSQGLDRVCADALAFRGAIFTNLSHEHLDWHGSIDNYARAKRRLFEILSENRRDDSFILANADDKWALKITGGLKVKSATFGIASKADFTADRINMTSSGTDFTVRHPGGEDRISIKLPGLFNVSNALAAYAAAVKMNIARAAVRKGLSGLNDVPGRMSKISIGKNSAVYIDYAHTPDALRKVLVAIRAVCSGRLICVFGCGGNRDREKRPLMGKIAAEISDFVWITSDNSRDENPSAIALDIEVGARSAGGNYKVEVDRLSAIEGALKMAEKDDIILIAGKGHENYQIAAGKRIPYSDFDAVKKTIKKLQKENRM